MEQKTKYDHIISWVGFIVAGLMLLTIPILYYIAKY